jgi:hypothetical protein
MAVTHLVDVEFVKAVLQNLVIVHELVLLLGPKIDLAHGNLAWVQRVDDLTVRRACRITPNAGWVAEPETCMCTWVIESNLRRTARL